MKILEAKTPFNQEIEKKRHRKAKWRGREKKRMEKIEFLKRFCAISHLKCVCVCVF